MYVDQVKEILGASGFVLDEERAIQYGVQLKFSNGYVESVFDNGTRCRQSLTLTRVCISNSSVLFRSAPLTKV